MKSLNPLNSLLVFLVWIAITIGPTIYKLNGKKIELGENLFNGIAYNLMSAALFLILFVFITNSYKKLGLQLVNLKNLKLLYIPFSVIGMILIFLFINNAFQKMDGLHWLFLNCIFVGISEELMFRGVLFSGFYSKFGFKKAAIVVILLFGLVHILNSFITGALQQGLLQAFMAMSSGILYLVIRIKNYSIIPIILVHSIWDFSVFCYSKSVSILPVNYFTLLISILLVASPIAFGIIGIYLLTRKETQTEFESQQLVN